LIFLFFVSFIILSPLINSTSKLIDISKYEEAYEGEYNFDEFLKYLEMNKKKQSETLKLKYKEKNLDSTENTEDLIIIFKKKIDVKELNSIKIEGISYYINDKIPELHAVLLDTKRNDMYDFIDKIGKIKDVECVQPNHYRFLSYQPDDPLWDESWGHKLINCDKAWDIPTNMDCTWLTIIDTGIDCDHEDLRSAKIYQWDFIENDGTADDDTNTGHGTNVTGIAMSRINNSIGLAGIIGNSPNIEVLKIFNQNKRTTVWLILKSILYSMLAHAPYFPSVICMSFGGENYNLIENSLMDQLRNGIKGIIFVSAVGNSGTTNRVDFPAAYESVIAVGAINSSGCLCSYPGDWGSNYNSKKREVDLVAPGINIITTINEDTLKEKYGYFSGTSAATAYVAGVAALWYGARAAKMSYRHRKNEPDRCESALFSNSKELDDNNRFKYGYGMVDAYQTISCYKSVKKYNRTKFFELCLNIFSIQRIIQNNVIIRLLLTNEFLYSIIINNIDDINIKKDTLGRTGK
jgi:hypothetical protein